MNDNKVALRIPCYNEGVQKVEYGDHNMNRIEATRSNIHHTLQLLKPHITDYYDTLILHNDGSYDDTLEQIELFLDNNPDLISKTQISNTTTNKGKAFSFFKTIEQLKEQGYDRIVTTDADLVYPGQGIFETLSTKAPKLNHYTSLGMIVSPQQEWIPQERDYNLADLTSGTRSIDINKFFKYAENHGGYDKIKKNTIGFGLEIMLRKVFYTDYKTIDIDGKNFIAPKFLHPFRTKSDTTQIQEINMTKQQLGVSRY